MPLANAEQKLRTCKLLIETNITQTDQWQLQLFGTLEVRTPTGERVVLSNRKAGELLAYLTLYPHQAHTRQKLTTVLWGEQSVDNDRTRLRQEIATLRSLFSSTNQSHPLVHIAHTELRINEEVKADVHHFQDIWASAKQELDLDQKELLLEKALSLYSAELLKDFDSAWILAERDRYNLFREQALFDLAEVHRQQQNFDSEEDTLRRMLSLNPLNQESSISLMRLYSEKGQPTRVLQQYQALERILYDAKRAAPNEETRILFKQLRHRADENAALLTIASPRIYGKIAEQTNDLLQELASEKEPHGFVTAVTEVRPPQPKPSSPSSRRTYLVLAAIVIISLAAGIWRWKHTDKRHILAAAISGTKLFNPKWTYLDPPGKGELMDSQGNAVTRDDGGYYITGQMQTENEDTDILTVKISNTGHELWRARYSSPEHDCDRANSIFVNLSGAVYVLGETCVPDKPNKPGAWYFTVLVYKAITGEQQSFLRSKIPVENEMQHMKIVDNHQRGCYVCGTGYLKGKHSFLFIEYNAMGEIVFQSTFAESEDFIYSSCTTSDDGTFYVCGNGKKKNSDGIVSNVAMILCIDGYGKQKWIKPINKNTSGNSYANSIIRGSNSNIYIAGVVDTGSPLTGGKGLQLALDIFDPNGNHVGHHLVSGSGPNVQQKGIAINPQGDIAIGGDEINSDGTIGIVLAKFNYGGDQEKIWRYPIPKGYRSAELNIIDLERDGTIRYFGRLTKSVLNDDNSVLVGSSNFEGEPLSQSIYTNSAGTRNFPEDRVDFFGGRVVAGQASDSTGGHMLMVNGY